MSRDNSEALRPAERSVFDSQQGRVLVSSQALPVILAMCTSL